MIKEEAFFGPFRLDLANESVWCHAEARRLTPKVFSVLRYLVEHAGQLVTKEALFAAVWPGTVVSDAALVKCIKKVRQVLGDDPKAPHYIETVHGRGYRFIAAVQGSLSQPILPPQSLIPNFVGREAELDFLKGCFDKVLAGERQIVFVTGEAGIGKTALVETFVASAKTAAKLWIGHGQCIEHYGVGEAYLPVLEAFGRLCREPAGHQLIDLLTQYAPTWMVQMPALLEPPALGMLQPRVVGASQLRMLREIAEAIEAIAARKPLILVLEDLHWSDSSTVELLAALARRRELARLMVLASYRPVEVFVQEHSLKSMKQELQLHGQCQEVALTVLTENAVSAYITERFGAALALDPLPQFIHRRTDGNPLFMASVTDYLIRQEVLGQDGGKWTLQQKLEDIDRWVPETLRQLIEQQLEQVSAEGQGVLEAASLIGAEFSAAAVAAGINTSVEAVERQADTLVRRGQFLEDRETEEWPDGTIAGQYRFIHTLYKEVLSERMSVSQRSRLHRQIGERLEAGYKEWAGELATKLAVHFELGRDYPRAVRYLQQAGENALHRNAYQEAIRHLTKGLTLLQTLPNTPERAQQELLFQSTLGPALMVTKSLAAPEVEQTYTRARDLCQRVGETPQLALVLWGLRLFYQMRAEYQTARELGEQLLHLAQHRHNPVLLARAHVALGETVYTMGEYSSAQAHLEQAIVLAHPHSDDAALYVADVGVPCFSYAAVITCLLGYPDQARTYMKRATSLAQEYGHPPSLILARGWAAVLHCLLREERACYEQVNAAIRLATDQGLLAFLSLNLTLRGWALAQQGQEEEGITQIRQGLVGMRKMGMEMSRALPLSRLAEIYGQVGRIEEGLEVLAQALWIVDTTGGRYCESRLYRVQGELLLAQDKKSHRARGKGRKVKIPAHPSPVPNPQAAAAERFWTAINIAREQGTKLLELQAAMRLSRLWQQQGKKQEARQLLAEIYGWFTEGFDIADLQEAKGLLVELS